MKQVAIAFLIFLSFKSYSQYPKINTGERLFTIQKPLPKDIIPYTSFLDTLSANKTPVKDYYGAIIYTYGDKKMYFRTGKPYKWVELLPSGSQNSLESRKIESKKCCRCCKNKKN